jgi:hypothetical protein
MKFLRLDSSGNHVITRIGGGIWKKEWLVGFDHFADVSKTIPILQLHLGEGRWQQNEQAPV